MEESISKLKKYYDYHGIEYKWIRDAGNLFNQSIDKDCYKLIRTVSVLNIKVIILNMKVKEIKTKFCQLKNTLIWSGHI